MCAHNLCASDCTEPAPRQSADDSATPGRRHRRERDGYWRVLAKGGPDVRSTRARADGAGRRRCQWTSFRDAIAIEWDPPGSLRGYYGVATRERSLRESFMAKRAGGLTNIYFYVDKFSRLHGNVLSQNWLYRMHPMNHFRSSQYSRKPVALIERERKIMVDAVLARMCAYTVLAVTVALST
ncbi:hypothetical protein EVAR_16911_1 [Eumeta japonica]|uniref:Uncharacterized protein n=1 Tax=Eumeta variegata TaxID=151549 RepID=A0A4C1TVC3_EUMVA|nr:hypothetical protein EVAR_16911_1 [Eumeta japonica]